MNSHWKPIVLFAAGVWGANFLSPWNLGAQGQAPAPPSEGLAGLDGVLVAVDLPSETATLLRIDKSAIADRVDRQLRTAGVRNLGREESIRQGAAELRVTLRAARIEDSAQVAYGLSIGVWEPVQLVRDRSRTHVAATWQSPGVVAAGQPPLTDVVLRQFDEQVAAFVRGYREANRQ